MDVINLVLFFALVLNVSVGVFSQSTSPPPVVGKTVCDFEQGGLCQWSSRFEEHLRWIVVNGSQVGATDHTHGSKSGRVLSTTGRDNVNGKVSLVSSKLPWGYHCLQVYVRIPSEGMASFTVLKLIQNLVVPLYRTKGREIAGWERIQVTSSSRIDYQIVLMSEQASGELGYILLDDVRVLAGQCPMEPLAKTNVTCDFEDRQRRCGFRTDQSQVGSWLLSNVTVLRQLSLTRLSDHSQETNSGHVLISQIDGSETKAVARSPVLQGTGYHCLKFYYLILLGDSNTPITNKGTLSVFAVPKGQNATDLSPWLRGTWTTGNGMSWIEATTAFPMMSEYQIVFESASEDDKIVCAIDDISIEECPPPDVVSTVSPSTPTPKIVVVKVDKSVSAKTEPWVVYVGGGAAVLVIIIIVTLVISRKRIAGYRQQGPPIDNVYMEEDSDCPNFSFNNPIFSQPEQETSLTVSENQYQPMS